MEHRIAIAFGIIFYHDYFASWSNSGFLYLQRLEWYSSVVYIASVAKYDDFIKNLDKFKYATELYAAQTTGKNIVRWK